MIDYKKHFSIDDEVHIASFDRENKVLYKTKIIELYDEYIDVLIPVKKNTLIYFNHNENLKISILKQKAIYEFDAIVVGRNYSDAPIVRLKAVSDFKKIQRRDFFRLRVTRPLKFRIIHKNDIFGETSENYEGNLLDISGGGMMFTSKKELELGEFLELEFSLNKKDEIILHGDIIRKYYDKKTMLFYEYGVKFKNLSASDKDLLIKFIFDEQRKLLKRGLI